MRDLGIPSVFPKTSCRYIKDIEKGIIIFGQEGFFYSAKCRSLLSKTAQKMTSEQAISTS